LYSRRFYKAGTPWPLLPQTIEHRVSLYAETFNVSRDQAAVAIEAWCQAEEADLAALYERAQACVEKPGFEHAVKELAAFPVLQTMIDYSEGVVVLTGEELASVFAIHLAALSYAIEHPDRDANLVRRNG
jgi:hypothetical protein